MRVRINPFAFGILAGAAVSAVTIPLLTWFYPQDTVGRLSFFVLAITFFVQVGTLGLEQGFVREYASSDDRYALASRVVVPSLLLFGGLSIVIVLCELGPQLAVIVFGEIETGYLSVLLVSALLAVLSRFLTVFLRVWGLGWQFAAQQILSKVLFLIFAAISYLMFSEEAFPLYFSYASSLVLAWILSVSYLVRIRPQFFSVYLSRWSLKHIFSSSLFGYSFPILCGAVAFWGVKFSGHVALRLNEQFSSLGLYSVGVSMAVGFAIIGSIFNTLWAPFLFKKEAKGFGSEALGFGMVLTIALILFGLGGVGLLSPIVVQVVPEPYASLAHLLPALVFGPFLYTLSEVTGAGIALSRKTRYSLYAGVVASLSALSVALLLVPSYGAEGATLGYVVGYFVFFLLRTEWGRRLYKTPRVSQAYIAGTFGAVYVALHVIDIDGFSRFLPWIALIFVFASLFFFLSALRLRQVFSG